MTDIRKGDLVKATDKTCSEEYFVARIVHADGMGLDTTSGRFFDRSAFDFEVLERPIDEELLNGARNAWRAARHGLSPVDFAPGDDSYAKEVTAVIEFVRTYDKEHAK